MNGASLRRGWISIVVVALAASFALGLTLQQNQVVGQDHSKTTAVSSDKALGRHPRLRSSCATIRR